MYSTNIVLGKSLIFFFQAVLNSVKWERVSRQEREQERRKEGPAVCQRTYHVAFRGIFQGLNHFQSLFESHLLN